MHPCTPYKAKKAALASDDTRVWFAVVNQARGSLSVEWCYAKDILAHDKKGRRNLFIDMLLQQWGADAHLYVLTRDEADTLRSEMREYRASAEYREAFSRALKAAEKGAA